LGKQPQDCALGITQYDPGANKGEIMSSLLIFAFSDQDGASKMITEIKSLQTEQLISISDAATVIRKPDGNIIIEQATSLVGSGTLGGAFWGMLVGVIFYMPWLGMASSGARAGKLSDYGIDDNFIKDVGVTIGPGQSALFLIVSSMAEDRVIGAVSRHKATLLRTNLGEEDENRLREAFPARS
jgi:uncharacterized membrane protein